MKLEILNSQAIANAFNNYFSTVGSSLANSIPIVQTNIETFLNAPLCHSFVLYPASIIEIEDEISKLNSFKSTGPFSISTKLLKTLRFLLSGPLTYLFNCSISTGVVPDKLKIARVIPVYKNGPKAIVSNYRPISLLSIFNKILEKLIYKRLLHFLEQNHVLFDGQFGFRTNLSTTHAILLITDKIQRAIENKLYSCGIFLDLSKAFDTVNHTILLKKLEKYGVRGVANDWFCSYLSNRRQFVSIGNSVSEYKPITCGVPQGSVLGPLLFLLYINDFNKCAPNIDFHLYADDSNLFCSHKSLQVLETILNDQLNSINEWLCANKLSLNVDKSNFVIFHPPQKSPTYSINLKIHDKVIMQKRSIKYLGVLIDSSLNWKDHIHELSKKISRGIGILLKLRKCVSTQILLQFYYSIIYTFFTYGVLIWGNTYKTNLYPLIILQKKAVRIITFSDFLAHTSPLFKELNLLKFIDIVDFHTALFMFRYSRGNLPGNFDGYFHLVCNTHLYGTRAASKTTFSLPLTRTNYGLFNIRFCGPKVWNTIDESFKSLSMNCFKKKFKNQIIGLY